MQKIAMIAGGGTNMQSGDREKHSTRRADCTIHPSPQDLIYIVADEFHVNPADLYCENNED